MPNEAYAKYFIGDSFLNFLVKLRNSLFPANVTFEPRRNNWHIHHATSGGGQMLLCTGGEGWYQQENEAPVSLMEGSVVYIPAGKSTGMAPKPIAGLAISQSRLPNREHKRMAGTGQRRRVQEAVSPDGAAGTFA